MWGYKKSPVCVEDIEAVELAAEADGGGVERGS